LLVKYRILFPIEKFVFVDDQGKEAENELNKIGPGEATFIFADVTKEEDIQVKG
jgi:hypothetical protein